MGVEQRSYWVAQGSDTVHISSNQGVIPRSYGNNADIVMKW